MFIPLVKLLKIFRIEFTLGSVLHARSRNLDSESCIYSLIMKTIYSKWPFNVKVTRHKVLKQNKIFVLNLRIRSKF